MDTRAILFSAVTSTIPWIEYEICPHAGEQRLHFSRRERDRLAGIAFRHGRLLCHCWDGGNRGGQRTGKEQIFVAGQGSISCRS